MAGTGTPQKVATEYETILRFVRGKSFRDVGGLTLRLWLMYKDLQG